ncbi:MAG: hypothetical protein E7157_02885 [Lactobacillales bacterium]|nr:hypothetical protein [Lactobacillales bacterium]
MDKKTSFKEFVKKNPSLLTFVKEEKMTWQKFYEMYDLYGESDDIWNEYIKKEEVITTTSSIGMLDVLNWLKTIDLDKMQESISSVQRVLGVLEDLGTNNNQNTKPEYKPRPIYKHFED